MKTMGLNEVNEGHDHVDEEETKPSSQRQRIMKALLTDDIVKNTEGVPFPPTVSTSPSSSYSPPPLNFSYDGGMLKDRDADEPGSNVSPDELAARFGENSLELKNGNGENATSIREMDDAIHSLRMWQQRRKEQMDNQSSSPNFLEFIGKDFTDPDNTCSERGKDRSVQYDEEIESSMPLSARLADDNKIASIREMIVGPKQHCETSENILKNLEHQKKRVQEVEMNLMDGEIDMEDLQTRTLMKSKVYELEQQWNADGLEEMETKAESLKASLRDYNMELEKYL